MSIFIIVVLTIWSGMHLYVFWRAASVPIIHQHISRGWLVGIAVFLWASFILGQFLGHSGVAVIARPLEFLGANWLGVLFLMLSCLLAAEVITGFGFFLPRHSPAVRGGALLAAGILSVIALVQGFRPPVVRDYEVRLADLPPDAEGTVIVAISDLHLGSLLGERWLGERVEQVQALHPDALVLVGDIIEGHGQLEIERRMVPVLRRFSAPLGVWAVTGNHESHGDVEAAARIFQEAGIYLLRNTWKKARPGIIIAGVDDPSDLRESPRDPERIANALTGRPEGAVTIFLSHRPEEAEKAAAAGAHLMLSAHTHDGQIWPFNYIVRAVYPFMAGRYEVKGMPIIVCRGTGTWGPRMRLWRPSEVLRITLHSG